MVTHSSILAWRTPWAERPGGLQSMGSQRIGQHIGQQTINNTIHYTVFPAYRYERGK